MIQNKKGFTLVEILTVLAIVGVMAAVALVSMSDYGPKARSAKAQSMVSGVISAMISCWGNTDNSGNLASVNSPTVPGGGNSICNLGASYGAWPALSGDLSNYRYIAADIDINNTVGRRSSRWAFSVQSNSSSDDKKICCNSTMNGCKVSAAGTACAYNNPSN